MEYIPQMIYRALLLSSFFYIAVAEPAVTASRHRQTEIPGPVNADVLRVIDGDTILVAARPWPQQTIEVYVRLRGIDAPEMKSACSSIQAAGRQAQAALVQLIGSDQKILLSRITGDKYFGRVLADVSLANGRNPAQELLAAGYVASYEDRHRTAQSCGYWQ